MKTHHRHYCAGECGDWLTCSQAPDLCPTNWTCPTCELQQMDDYFRAQSQPQHSPQLELALTTKESDL